MTTSPVTYQFPGYPGRNIPGNELTVKVECRVLAPKLDMEMRRIMITRLA